MHATTGIIGDIHLDLAGTLELLDGPLANCGTVVCAGDMLDRGEAAPDQLLDELMTRAVRMLVGNHELAYLGGPSFPGMQEPAGRLVASRLRSLVLDGSLRAAVAVQDVLCVHAGVSRAFWSRHLRATCGYDADRIAQQLNRWLVNAVLHDDFSHPVFAAEGASVPGPFWARLDTDLLAGGLPPFRQAVGHVLMPAAVWLSDPEGGPGAVFPLLHPAAPPDDGRPGYLVLEHIG